MVRIPGFCCCGPGSIPGQGTEILQATQPKKKSYFNVCNFGSHFRSTLVENKEDGHIRALPVYNDKRSGLFFCKGGEVRLTKQG